MLRSFATSLGRDVHGHCWTYAGFVLAQLRPELVGRTEFLQIPVDAGPAGIISVDALIERASPRECVVIVHGLGGDTASRYVQLAALAAARAGLSSVRLGLRGANLDGADVYHAGLTDDLRALLASEHLAAFERITLIGYSMGGHIVLRYATEAGRDPRVQSVAAVCAPLDLDACVRAIQRRDRRPYQFHVLRALNAHYREVELRAIERGRRLAYTTRQVEHATTIREWDELVICPRYGFADPAAYYEAMSVGPRLATITLPTLLAVAEADPMVSIDTVEPWLSSLSPSTTAWRFQRGGHVAFPRGLRRPHVELEDELVAWLRAASDAR